MALFYIGTYYTQLKVAHYKITNSEGVAFEIGKQLPFNGCFWNGGIKGNMGKPFTGVSINDGTVNSIAFKENNQIYIKKSYLNGSLHGDSALIEYKTNGDFKRICGFKNGKQNGKDIRFYDNINQITNIKNYKNGIREGEQLSYLKNGLISCKYFYENGKRIKEIYYNKDGSVLATVFFDKRKMKCEGNKIKCEEIKNSYKKHIKFYKSKK